MPSKGLATLSLSSLIFLDRQSGMAEAHFSTYRVAMKENREEK